MPTYEYRCKACGHDLEVVQAFTDDALTKCDSCGADALRKVFGIGGHLVQGQRLLQERQPRQDHVHHAIDHRREASGVVRQRQLRLQQLRQRVVEQLRQQVEQLGQQEVGHPRQDAPARPRRPDGRSPTASSPAGRAPLRVGGGFPRLTCPDPQEARPCARSRADAGARPVLALRRQPRLWWLLTVAVALAAGWRGRHDRGRRRADAVRRGAPPTSWLVADQRPGGRARRSRLATSSLVERPAPLVPGRGAVERFPTATSVARGHRSRRGRRSGAAGPAGRWAAWPPPLPDGTRAVAIPVEPGLAPPLLVGDRVDVLVAARPRGRRRRAARASSSRPSALVVAVDRGRRHRRRRPSTRRPASRWPSGRAPSPSP